ncbi:alpha,alpha-phosphotrehalase [Companilactobacillus paralimentarius]|uniref:alpha,alpha-phosphotrehalase n=1 Tax=Companilactobacillus paralimentarius TaxID=83526 RepID=UPI000B185BE5|nr:alpha,alpha-phosphotrehalase [Companilactobacillus paralimentarius]MDR4934115.1 alpha,alpha-phosphotrehalase [Companilactobacillus paralimentarius]QFR70502.1 alpha,alpha-phosphotrehalase [Companilactobacillus paralimentarius]
MNKWWQNAVVYQVYPASYQDSNGDGIGDLPGITKRLDYIKKLGVDIVWLSPIYKSPQVDNGYDISDYKAINPDFGNMEDFDNLLSKAHKLGLKIMMDLVVNHTSDEHKWFQKSRKGKDNPYRDYYIWRDGKDGKAPNNWGSFFTGPAWKYDEQTGQYYLHLFAPQQPDLNWENKNVRHSVYDMMNWWADKGVDGFRMDVINYISKPEGLPDVKKAPDELYGNPEPVVANGHRIHEFLQEMNQNVMSKHKMVTVGEAPAVTTDEAQKYSNLNGKELDMVFQFEHVGLDSNSNPALGRWSDKKTSLTDLRENLTKWQTALAGKAWNSLYWNNHDQPRVVSRFGDDSTEEKRVLSAKMLATMLHFQQGTPFVFEGEEIGMTNAYFDKLSDYVDLDSINAYHQIVDEQHLLDGKTMLKYMGMHSRDNARTPMQWDDSNNAGFSDGTPWEHVNKQYKEINVKKALADPDSIFYYYQKIIKLRHELPVMVDGSYALVKDNQNDPDVYAYTRKDDDTTLLVVLNYTDKKLERHYDVPEDAKILISNYADSQGNILRPYEAKVYQF